MGIGPEPLRVQLVFIRINEARLGITVNGIEHEVEGGRRQLVFAPKEKDEFAVAQSQRIIQSAVDSILVASLAQLDSTITFRQPGESAARLFRRAARPGPE